MPPTRRAPPPSPRESDEANVENIVNAGGRSQGPDLTASGVTNVRRTRRPPPPEKATETVAVHASTAMKAGIGAAEPLNISTEKRKQAIGKSSVKVSPIKPALRIDTADVGEHGNLLKGAPPSVSNRPVMTSPKRSPKSPTSPMSPKSPKPITNNAAAVLQRSPPPEDLIGGNVTASLPAMFEEEPPLLRAPPREMHDEDAFDAGSITMAPAPSLSPGAQARKEAQIENAFLIFSENFNDDDKDSNDDEDDDSQDYGNGPGYSRRRNKRKRQGDNLGDWDGEVASEGSHHDTILSQAGKEVRCQVCLSEENILLLMPCWHWSMCQECYDGTVTKEDRQNGVTNKEVTCPICMVQVEDTMTQEEAQEEYFLELEEKKRVLRANTARRKAKRLLAGAQVQRKLGVLGYADDPIFMTLFNVSEEEMAKAFGPTSREVFSQARMFMVLTMAWAVFAAPVALVYALALTGPDSRKRLADNDWDQMWAFLHSLTISTCTMDACNNGFGLFINEFLILDSAFALLCAFVLRRMYRKVADPTMPHLEKDKRAKDDNQRMAERSLLLIQCPHLFDAVPLDVFNDFFIEQQLFEFADAKAYAESFGKRAHLQRDDAPAKILPCNATAVANCSSSSLEFARKALKRFDLKQRIDGLERRAHGAYSITVEHYDAKAYLAMRELEIDTLDVRYFDEVFYEEQLGATSRHKEPVEFVWLTFESVEHARRARKLLQYDKENVWLHHWRLMWGCPLTQFRCLGREGELYPDNIDLGALEHPLWYAQSGWPMRCLLTLSGGLLAFNLLGYLFWKDIQTGTPAAVLLVVWQLVAKYAVAAAFRWYRHPVKSFTRFWTFAAVMFGVYVPSLLVWPILLALRRSATLIRVDSGLATLLAELRDVWWSERQIEMLFATEVFYLVLAALWGLLGQKRYIQLLQLSRGKPHTQYHLEKKLEPPVWDFAQALLSPARTGLVAITFSSVAPSILIPCAMHLAVFYVSEKNWLLNHCLIEPRQWDQRPNNLLTGLAEAAIVLRLGISSLAVWAVFEASDSGSAGRDQLLMVPGINLSVPWIVITAFFGLLCFLHSLRFATVRRLLMSMLTCGDRLCYSCRYDYTTGRKRKAAAFKAEWDLRQENIDKLYAPSPDEAQLLDAEWLAEFDIRYTTKYSELFEAVYRVDDLHRWRPPEKKFTYATRPYESQYDSDKDDSFINLSHLD